MLDWIPRKLRYLLGILAALSLLAPTGISHDTVIVGHTVFKNMSGYDKCLASIVGLARTQVLWFNDMALVERDAKGMYLYAVESDSDSPLMDDGRSWPIAGDGVVYDFYDPNGARWVVLQGYYNASVASTPQAGGTPPKVEGDLETKVTYVWIVQVSHTLRDAHAGNDLHEFYNFVNIVDTCKFDRKKDGNVTHGANDPNHPAGDAAHEHEVYSVDLYLGREPKFIPAAVNTSDPAAYAGIIGTVQP